LIGITRCSWTKLYILTVKTEYLFNNIFCNTVGFVVVVVLVVVVEMVVVVDVEVEDEGIVVVVSEGVVATVDASVLLSCNMVC
jgi:hypothetical protein